MPISVAIVALKRVILDKLLCYALISSFARADKFFLTAKENNQE